MMYVHSYIFKPDSKIVEARIWKNLGWDIDILKVVLATNGFNFEGYKGYEVYWQEIIAPDDFNAFDYMETDSSPSWVDPDATPGTATEEPRESPTLKTTTEAPTDETTYKPASRDETGEGSGLLIPIIIVILVIVGASIIIIGIKKLNSFS